MSFNPSILICDDDSTFRRVLNKLLKDHYHCIFASNTDEASQLLRKHSIDIVLLDIQMRTDDEGIQFIPKIKDLDPEVAIIMLSGSKDFSKVRDSMRFGASDYISKDFELDQITHILDRVIATRQLKKRNQQQNYEAQSNQMKNVFVGESPQIIALRKMLERVRASQANVVITGETGTGKEVVARLLRGTLSDGTLASFVAVDSSTIQSATAESILFGHEKGAFTGADKRVTGLFEEADQGIIYFDEISNMPLEIQAKLLRVIQEKELIRMGSTKVIQLQFRVVCATNKSLVEMVQNKLFKEDLFQRLNVIPLHVPPLRERISDIPILVDYWVKKQPYPANQMVFTPEAMHILQNYPWPGNVRELGNMIAFLAAMVTDLEVDVADLPPMIRDLAQGQQFKGAPVSVPRLFYDRVSEFERSLLAEEYKLCEQNVSQMAIKLGMNRSHLHMKLKEHQIKRS